ITTDLKTMMKDVAGSSFGDNGLDPTLLGVDFSSPVTMDILVDPATLLPFTLEANRKLDFGQESMDVAMKFKFFDYNARVDIPEPPKRSEEHTSELQSRFDLVCRLLLEKKNKKEKDS